MKKIVSLLLLLALTLTAAAAFADQTVDVGFFTLTVPDASTVETFPEYSEGTRPLLLISPDPDDPSVRVTALFRQGAADPSAMADPAAGYLVPLLASYADTYADDASGITYNGYDLLDVRTTQVKGHGVVVFKYVSHYVYGDGERSDEYTFLLVLAVEGGVCEVTGTAPSAEDLEALGNSVMVTVP